MSLAVNTLADRARRLAGDYPALATLTSSSTTTATAVAVDTPNNFQVGKSIVIDQEMLYVTAVNGTTSGSTLTVVRAWAGSTAQTHASAAPVLINPQFSPAVILDALNEGLRQLWPYWFKWVKDETLVTTGYLQADYDMPAAFGESGIITSMEVLFPGLSNDGWRQFRWFRHLEGTTRTVSLIRVPPVSTKLRLIGIAPFTADLDYGGNTDAQLLDSGITALMMYVQHYLQLQAESVRQNATTAKNIGPAGSAPGQHQALSALFMQRFLSYCQTHAQRYPTWRTRRRI